MRHRDYKKLVVHTGERPIPVGTDADVIRCGFRRPVRFEIGRFSEDPEFGSLIHSVKANRYQASGSVVIKSILLRTEMRVTGTSRRRDDLRLSPFGRNPYQVQ